MRNKSFVMKVIGKASEFVIIISIVSVVLVLDSIAILLAYLHIQADVVYRGGPEIGLWSKLIVLLFLAIFLGAQIVVVTNRWLRSRNDKNTKAGQPDGGG